MKQVMIWGTGNNAKECVSNIDNTFCRIVAFIESNPQRKYFNSIRIISPSEIKGYAFDFIIIASQYEDEIVNAINKLNLKAENVISWIRLKNNIFCYPKEIADLFIEAFQNTFFFGRNKNTVNMCGKDEVFIRKLERYSRIYVYNFDFSKGDIAFCSLIKEILDCLDKKNVGMVFIASGSSDQGDWYQMLLGVLKQYACVIEKGNEKAFFYYVKEYCEKVSFERFNLFISKQNFKRIANRSVYWKYSQKRETNDLEKIAKKYKNINFYELWNTRVGEFIRNITYISVQEEKENELNIYIPFNQGNQITFEGANSCLTDLVGRKMYLVNNRSEYFFWIEKIFQDSGKFRFCGSILPFADVKKLEAFPKTPYVDFEADEKKLGQKIIKDKLGLNNQYVCILLRDSQYLSATNPTIDCSYHNYRDNVPFDIVKKTLRYFKEKEISAVRVGQTTINKLTSDDLCVDFPNICYDEFLDLMLHRNCKFLLGGDTGGILISTFFGKPIAVLDTSFPYFDVYLPDLSNSIGIFNLLLSIRENRLLTFREIFEASRTFKLYRNKGKTKVFYQENGFAQVPYTEDDVLGLAKEMNDRLDGTWKDTKEDIILRNRFKEQLNEFLSKYEIDNFVYSQHEIATSFLRKNKHLL